MVPELFLITGVMASGKSTVGELLAGRLGRGVHLRGDVFRRMIVSGREEMSERPSSEALSQLHLRYRLAAQSARMYLDAGFSVVLQDNYYGRDLEYMLHLLEGCPVHLVVLCPSVGTVKKREAERGKTGYSGFSVEGLFKSFMEETPRLGYWIDSSYLTPWETAEKILEHFGIAEEIEHD